VCFSDDMRVNDHIERPKLILIDGNSLVYRAFFALPELSTAAGVPTNAVYGFTTMLLRLLDEERPQKVLVAFDKDKETFRHKEYEAYKAHRPRTPDELISQMPLVREVLETIGIPMLEESGYEADDIIGTLSVAGAKSGYEVIIVTGDQDALQLITKHVKVAITTKGISQTKRYGVHEVEERFGFGPEMMNDYRALKGDPSDNIPGVPGIGEKTATALVQKFGHIENLYNHLQEVDNERIRRLLTEYKEQAELSKRLSVICKEVPLDFDLEKSIALQPQRDEMIDLFRRLGFNSLVKRLLKKQDADAVLPADSDKHFEETVDSKSGEAVVDQQPLFIHSAQNISILAPKQLALMMHSLRKAKRLAIDLLLSAGSTMTCDLLGVALATEDNEAYFIPTGLSEGDMRQTVEAVRPLLEDAAIPKYGYNLKDQLVVLRRYGISPASFRHDVMLASYLINPTRQPGTLEGLALEWLSRGLPECENLSGNKLKREALAEEYDNYGICMNGRVQAVMEMIDPMLRNLDALGLMGLYRDMEMPLIYLLADMEYKGVAIDLPYLQELSDEMGKRIFGLEESVFDLAGERFNIGSPKQLQRILFEKLRLPTGRKTKTGYSTDVHVLEGLAEHPIVGGILEYRELTKLKSTYVDALPKIVNSETGRVHTSFNNTATATGRLSSSDPNLQNIPVKGDWGRKIRRAFLAAKGYSLLKADYSQIELRVLAHLSQDQGLIKAFRSGEDIHTHTAADIYGVAHENVTPDMRRVAKTVNFGLLYGMGEQRLARDLGISVKEAEGLIQRYFDRFPSVKGYMQKIIMEAKQEGYVRTLLGRLREIGDIHSRNPMLRAAAERAATNTPLQGTAADIIKIAMNNIFREMNRLGLKSRMILQIHDELLFEVLQDEAAAMEALVEKLMEEAVELSVPLEVELETGPNWQDMKPQSKPGWSNG
jgi:DNA polymerase-1